MFRAIILAAGTSLLLSSAAFAADAAPSASIKAAVADSHRPAKDTENDAARKPAEMLRFAGVKPGSIVVDIMPGSGYFTRVFAKTVGKSGHVYAYQPTETDKYYKGKPAPINAVADDPAYGNITVIHKSINDFAIPQKADVIWTSQNYHDLHDDFMGPADIAKVNKAVFDALKPGGVFVVLDHTAKAGTGLADTDTLHRIDPAVVKKEVEAAGFKFAGEDNALRNPKDDHTLKVFDPKIRHHTDQFIYKFQKPE